MTLFDYRAYLALKAQNPPFYALIMAAMEKADDKNIIKLREAWPDTWAELDARYHLPGGLLPGETAPEDLRIPVPDEEGER